MRAKVPASSNLSAKPKHGMFAGWGKPRILARIFAAVHFSNFYLIIH